MTRLTHQAMIFAALLGGSSLTASAATCDSESTHHAAVTVNNISGPEGNIRVQIYSDDPGEWLEKGKKLVRVDTPATANKGGSQEICVPVPGAGTFAFVVMHDKNANGKADIFSEGFGFSNNPDLGLSKPDHEDVIVSVNTEVTKLSIDLKYVFGGPKKKRSGRRRG